VPSARNWFAMGIFPVVLAASIAATIALMDAGVSATFAFVPPIAAVYLLVMTLERVLPFHRSWQRSYGDIHVDLGHMIVSGGIGLELLRPLMLMLAVAIGSAIAKVAPGGAWPGEWPLLAQLLLALVIGEFFMYWVHRLAHEWEWLWRFHAVHHSAPRLYFLNAARFHPVDLAISNFAPFVPLVALGAQPEVLALFSLFSAVHGAFQHANVPILLGPLNWFFSMAELHRWHHSRVLDEANTNYGQNLIIWDVVFGTRFLPADREPPEDIGLTGLSAFPMSYLGQLASPFTWRRIERESTAGEATAARTEERRGPPANQPSGRP
jgi:sterol desaturase/sphingolipid hydroxylase (fatty acid hydroxylase superfamily)